MDASQDRWAISPDVYGMSFADPALQTELGLTLSRWGGNATSRYNWTNNTTNLGSDWYFGNYVKPSAESLDATVAANRRRGTRTVVTVPMTGWVAKDSPASHPWYCGFSIAKYGPQTGSDPWDTDCGNGVKAAGGNVTGNDPKDTSVAAGPAFVQAMVAHLVATHGAGGRYNLDNEPSLWNSTHRDVHPAPVTYDELWRWEGDGAYRPSGSPVAGVTVRGRVSSTLSPATMARGGTARITGSVAPRHPGARVALQAWVTGSGWRTLGYAYLSATSTFAFAQRPTTPGTRRYRVLWVGDADHYPDNGPTHTLTVT